MVTPAFGTVKLSSSGARAVCARCEGAARCGVKRCEAAARSGGKRCEGAACSGVKWCEGTACSGMPWLGGSLCPEGLMNGRQQPPFPIAPLHLFKQQKAALNRLALIALLVVFCRVSLFYPGYEGHPDNLIPANPCATPLDSFIHSFIEQQSVRRSNCKLEPKPQG
eukprot:144958-Chlamydomonas_euryale.AAC.1